MRFNSKARVDSSEFEDVGGRGRSGGGSGFPMPSGGGGKIGLGTVVVIVVFLVLSQCTGNGIGGLLSDDGGSSGSQTGGTRCETGADANASDTCAVALFTRSVQDYWERTYPEQTGRQYVAAGTRVFSGQTSSGCGAAAAAMGPFYCPPDQRVYLDSTFFDDMLEGQLGAKGGTFSIGYVIAHEYGHHVENLLGILGRMRTQQGAKSDAVKVELMADCLAGMWAAGAEQTRDREGNTIIEGLTKDDISRAIDAAQAVGDDRIQERSSGRVDPESWTHGSAAQRMHWFNVGLTEGSISACDTFRQGAL